ncbi:MULTISPECIES: hypothetical protein [Lysobacteraceae]|jgi:hypothetical protein|uniref:Uncharacterized protein n=1 Tax=Agrilutibacter niabensis TaxID=380628 RepID=A0ABU1VMA7_9GAMM|nr:hypothetical protein [Lysobacter niabensis]MDR7098460.1 hypothetical protein [Lysobacter niabensis]
MRTPAKFAALITGVLIVLYASSVRSGGLVEIPFGLGNFQMPC